MLPLLHVVPYSIFISLVLVVLLLAIFVGFFVVFYSDVVVVDAAGVIS